MFVYISAQPISINIEYQISKGSCYSEINKIHLEEYFDTLFLKIE